MNEKIREFEIECWVQREHCTAWFDSAKFAKLLLDHVLEIVKNHTSEPDPWSERYDELAASERTANYIRDDIKYIFGLEE